MKTVATITVSVAVLHDEPIAPLVAQALRDHARRIDGEFHSGAGPAQKGAHDFMIGDVEARVTWEAEFRRKG